MISTVFNDDQLLEKRQGWKARVRDPLYLNLPADHRPMVPPFPVLPRPFSSIESVRAALALTHTAGTAEESQNKKVNPKAADGERRPKKGASNGVGSEGQAAGAAQADRATEQELSVLSRIVELLPVWKEGFASRMDSDGTDAGSSAHHDKGSKRKLENENNKAKEDSKVKHHKERSHKRAKFIVVGK